MSNYIKINPLSKSTGNLLADCSALCGQAYTVMLNLQRTLHYTQGSGHPQVLFHECDLCNREHAILIDLSRAHMLLRERAEHPVAD